MPAKQAKAPVSDDAADHAWLMGVLSRIPDSVYGRQTGKAAAAEEDALGTVQKKKKKNSKKNKGKGKKLTEMPEKMTELQQRLKDKIAGLRDERKADDAELIAKREMRKRMREEKKDKVSAANHRKRQKKHEKGPAPADARAEEAAESDGYSAEAAADGEPAEKVIEVSRLEGFDRTDTGDAKARKRPRTKMTRLNELEKQLGDAIEMRGNSGGGEEDERAKQKEVGKALLRAKGVVVKDDVAKLRKTIRKEKRKSEKSKEEWGERVKTLEEEKATKQAKREENLKERRESNGKRKSKGKGKGGK